MAKSHRNLTNGSNVTTERPDSSLQETAKAAAADPPGVWDKPPRRRQLQHVARAFAIATSLCLSLWECAFLLRSRPAIFDCSLLSSPSLRPGPSALCLRTAHLSPHSGAFRVPRAGVPSSFFFRHPSRRPPLPWVVPGRTRVVLSGAGRREARGSFGSDPASPSVVLSRHAPPLCRVLSLGPSAPPESGRARRGTVGVRSVAGLVCGRRGTARPERATRGGGGGSPRRASHRPARCGARRARRGDRRRVGPAASPLVRTPLVAGHMTPAVRADSRTEPVPGRSRLGPWGRARTATAGMQVAMEVADGACRPGQRRLWRPPTRGWVPRRGLLNPRGP